MYTEHDLFVGVECTQRGVPVTRRLTRRDRDIDTDSIAVDLDTRGDGTTAFHFQVTAAGTLIDGIRYDDTSYSSAWDENWEAETAVGPDGWTAEIRLPLRALRFAPDRTQTWGLQIRRFTSARQELDAWSYIPPTVAGEVSHYGRLGPLRGLPRHAGLELRPFVASRARRRDPDDEVLARGWDARGRVGLDAKWHIGQDLTLDATFAPDFGQVEADQVVLNLGTFEILREEKRPFFLEGLDVLSTPIQLVYTRRIGAVPYAPAIRDGPRFREALVDAPEPSTIWAAGKIVGRIAPRLTLGALSAVVGPNEVDVRTATNDTVARLADPATVFQVVRLKRELGDNAHVGLLAAATLRLEPATAPIVSAPSEPVARWLCPDGSETARRGDCFRDAFVGGIDGRVRGGDWVAQGQLVGSVVRGGVADALPDGTVVASGDAAPGGRIRIAKEGGEHWIGEVQYEAYGRRLALDDLGYLVRPNFHHLYTSVGYQQTEPTGPFLWANTAVQLYGNWNLDGLHGPRGLQLEAYGKLRNRIFVWGQVHARPSWFDDREVGDGTALQREGLYGIDLWVETDTGSPVFLAGGVTAQRIADGHWARGELGVTLRPLPALELSVIPTLLHTEGEPRWVDDREDGAHQFGRQRAEELSITLRATWTFAPRLTLQVYGQLFVAAVHYRDFSIAALGDRRVSLDELEPAPGPLDDPDYQDAALNVSAVLRWEWSLGAVLYLVYSRAQTASPVIDPERGPLLDPGPLRDGRAVDALLFKLSWWWGEG